MAYNSATRVFARQLLASQLRASIAMTISKGKSWADIQAAPPLSPETQTWVDKQEANMTVFTANGSPLTPLTEGTHQRADDSYFEVYWQGTNTSYAGWYWMNFEYTGDSLVPDYGDNKNHGPYNTCAAAARAGWANDPEASDA